MLRTLANLRSIEIGFRAERLLTMQTTISRQKYADQVSRLSFYDRVQSGQLISRANSDIRAVQMYLS